MGGDSVWLGVILGMHDHRNEYLVMTIVLGLVLPPFTITPTIILRLPFLLLCLLCLSVLEGFFASAISFARN